MKKLLLLLSILIGSTAIYAQTVDDYLQLMKADLDTERKAIFIENMRFSEEESLAFWPIYDDYRAERAKLAQEKLAIYKGYLENYENLNSEEGEKLMTRYFKLNESVLKLEKKYFTKMKTALSPQRAVQFFQLENRINLLVQLEVASQLPISTPQQGE